MKGCFFGKKPTAELEFVLKVLDCSDLIELASMYGEARDGFKSPELQRVVNDRIEVITAQAEAAKGGAV